MYVLLSAFICMSGLRYLFLYGFICSFYVFVNLCMCSRSVRLYLCLRFMYLGISFFVWIMYICIVLLCNYVFLSLFIVIFLSSFLSSCIHSVLHYFSYSFRHLYIFMFSCFIYVCMSGCTCLYCIHVFLTSMLLLMSLFNYVFIHVCIDFVIAVCVYLLCSFILSWCHSFIPYCDHSIIQSFFH